MRQPKKKQARVRACVRQRRVQARAIQFRFRRRLPFPSIWLEHDPQRCPICRPDIDQVTPYDQALADALDGLR